MLNADATIKKEVIPGPWKSALLLILSNIITMGIAFVEQWSISKVIWIYWGQSVIIGYYNWKRIGCLREYSTDGFTINDQPVSATKITQRQVANLFAVHYGFFHIGYLVFLFIEKADLSKLDILTAVICLAVFNFNHRFSFQRSIEKYIESKPNIGTAMFFPYARILPMHLTILFGSYLEEYTVGTVMLFLGLKTFADLVMHLIEHRQFRGAGNHGN